jgi:uncharacterized LabA/DUF88 family protein
MNDEKGIALEIMNMRNKSVNASVYVDYENLVKRLKEYNVNPISDLDFFKKLGEYLRSNGFNIVNFTAYANFDDRDMKFQDQTSLQSNGISTKHTCNDGKTSADLELAIDALKDLYKYNDISAFIIISSDRDFISLIKAIKLENRYTFVISTKNGFNEVVKNFTNHHEYIEDIFEFKKSGIEISKVEKTEDMKIGVQEGFEITDELKEKANDVCSLLLGSIYWKKYKAEGGDKVGLNGYASVIKNNVWKHETKENIIKYFHIAHSLEYITICKDKDGLLFFEEGNKTNEINKKSE